MGIGPIPWDKIVLYAKLYELDYENTKFFINVMRIVDGDFLKKASEDKPIEKKAELGRKYRKNNG